MGVLTDTVLEAQRDTLQAQRDTMAAVAEQLTDLNHRHRSIAAALQRIVTGQQRIADNFSRQLAF